MEPGHSGEPGVHAARPVEEDRKLAHAPAAQHHRAARAAAPSYSFVGPEGVQVIAIACIYVTQFKFFPR